MSSFLNQEILYGIKVVKKVLDANNEIAMQNRKMFSENKVFTVNMMSSPGSGKTSILEQTLSMIKHEMPVFQMSAKTGKGFQPWINWLKKMENAE